MVTYPDKRGEERPLAGPVTVRIGKGEMVTNYIGVPPQSKTLIGQVGMERPDLIADCTNWTLTPRYPRTTRY